MADTDASIEAASPNFRIPRYLSSTHIPEDKTAVLMVTPIGAGETAGEITGTLHVQSLPTIGDTINSAFGGYGFLEYNFYVIYVPYTVADLYGSGGIPSTDAAWNTLFRRLVFEYGTDGNQYYGAEVDGTSAATYDPIRNVWKRRSSSKTAAQGDVDVTDKSDAPYIDVNNMASYGPQGIQRLFAAERFLNLSGADSGVTSATSLSTAVGIDGAYNDAKFSDTIDIMAMANVTGPGFILSGLVRYKTSDVTDDFAMSYPPQFNSDKLVSASDRHLALKPFYAGDQKRVQHMIGFDNTDAGDYIRSILFGGDNHLEGAGSNVTLTSAYGANDGLIRQNDMIAALKMAVPIATPYDIALNV